MFDALRSGNFARAGEDCDFGAGKFPGSANFLQCRLQILGWGGNSPQDVTDAWRKLQAIEGSSSSARLTSGGWQYRRAMVAAVTARAGMPDSARAIMASARTPPQASLLDSSWLFYEAWVELLAGDEAQALELLAQYLVRHPERKRYARDHSWFAPVRSNSEFQRITS